MLIFESCNTSDSPVQIKRFGFKYNPLALCAELFYKYEDKVICGSTLKGHPLESEIRGQITPLQGVKTRVGENRSIRIGIAGHVQISRHRPGSGARKRYCIDPVGGHQIQGGPVGIFLFKIPVFVFGLQGKGIEAGQDEGGSRTR